MTIDPITLAAAANRLNSYNLDPYDPATNPYGLAGVGGADNNLEQALQDVATVGLGASEQAASAGGNATTATTAAAAAAASATGAAAAASEAAGSASSAAGSATTAGTAASNATGAAATASGAATTATTKAGEAATSAAAAAASATAAAGSASTAGTAATTATGAVTAATGAADTATTKAGEAAASATTAAGSATAAASSAASAAASAAGINLPSVTVADAGKALVVKPDGSGFQVGTGGGFSVSQTGPVLCASGGTMTVTGQAVLGVQEQVTGQTFNIGYTAEADYVQENAATGTDASGGAFTLANSAGAVIDTHTKLLIHADGANGSTEIVDERGIRLFGTGCAYFDGTARIAHAETHKLAWGSSQNFTIECWVRHTAADVTGQNTVFDTRGASNHGFQFGFITNGTNRWWIRAGTNGAQAYEAYSATTFTPADDTWHHMAVVRNGGIIKVYRDGVEIISLADGNNFGAAPMKIGSRSDNICNWTGWIDQFRISKVARYTGAFSPPTSEFTTDADTVYLFQFDDGHGSQFIRDSSRSGHELRLYNTAVISTAQAKFGVSSALISTTTNTAFINPATPKYHDDFKIGSNDFTWDGWFYTTTVAAQTLFSGDVNFANAIVTDSSNTLKAYAGTGASWNLANAVTIGTLTPNAWTHIAVTRSGTSLRYFVNGVLGATVTVGASDNIWAGCVYPMIGNNHAANLSFIGYVDEVRIKRGQAAWISGFTPPSSPYTTDDYTVLLCHFDGANGDKVTLDSSESSYGTNSFGDSTTPVLIFGGSAALSTAQTRGGNSTSLEMGAGKYVQLQYAPPTHGHPIYFALWEHFCIEGWFYHSNFLNQGGASVRVFQIIDSAGTYSSSMELVVSSSGVPSFWINNASAVATGSPLSIGWNHLAVVREGRGYVVYCNGVAGGSPASPHLNINYLSANYNLMIGSTVSLTGIMTGAIDSFRITHGKPRYTANFTPGNLTQDDDTALLWVFNGASGQKWVKELSKNTSLISSVNARTVKDGRYLTFQPNGQTSNLPTISTAQAAFGTGGLRFYGNAAHYTAEYSSEFNLTGDFAIEARVCPLSNGGVGRRIFTWCKDDTSASGQNLINMYLTTGGQLGLVWFPASGSGGTNLELVGSTVVPLNQWSHVAAVRSGTTIRLFVNGVVVASGTSGGFVGNTNSAKLAIGHLRTSDYLTNGNATFDGYIDEFRWSTGTDRGWTSNFTPPTLPYGQQYALGPHWVATKPGISSLDLSAFSSIDNAAFSGSVPATTTLKFLISPDAYATPLKRWTGSAWVSSGHSMVWNAGAGTLTTTATAAQLNTAGNSWAELAVGLPALDVPNVASLNVVAILSTANSQYSPVLDAITITMDEYMQLTPGADYTVRRRKAAGGQTLTITRTRAGTAYHEIDYVAG